MCRSQGAVTLFFAVALFATGMAGPFWALWAWTLFALPLWIASTTERPGSRVAGLAGTLGVSVGIIVIIRAIEASGHDVPEPLSTTFIVVILGWPVAKAILAWRLLRRPVEESESAAAAP